MSSTLLYTNLTARTTAVAIRATLGDFTPKVAIILGSGLGPVADTVQNAIHIPYTDIPNFPRTTVAGHAGTLVAGTIEALPTVIFSGRFHLYEGHPASAVAFPVRLAHALGARTLIVSNAVGAINPAFTPGALVLITDHLNLMGTSPLIGPQDDGDTRFPDMSNAYDPHLRATLRQTAHTLKIPLHEGIYAALPGPAYETPAEIRMLRAMGADAVCMSTVPEVITARALSMRVAGISCVTNMASGLTTKPPTHTEVLQVTAQAAHTFQTLLHKFLATATV